MRQYPAPEVERAAKVQEVILQAASGQKSRWQAAEILGIFDRSMRRWRVRYEAEGYAGLFDRRTHPSPQRGPCPTPTRSASRRTA